MTWGYAENVNMKWTRMAPEMWRYGYQTTRMSPFRSFVPLNSSTSAWGDDVAAGT